MLEPNKPDDQLPPNPDNLPVATHAEWSIMDLIVFSVFFGLTVVFLPLGAFYVMRTFRPGLRIEDLTTVEQIVLQGVMDLVLVGFIMFLVKGVHGRRFLETIHWYRQHPFNTGSLISLGATLAITVLLVSALFPSPQQTPIEKLITSSRSLYVFALFGIAVAPLFEEIIFRGFLFKVFEDMYSRKLAVPVTATLFALLHAIQLWGNLAAIGLIFVVGYILALLRARSGSLIPSWIVHTSYNAMLFGMYAISTIVQKGVVRPN